jgi:hypothetical protein
VLLLAGLGVVYISYLLLHSHGAFSGADSAVGSVHGRSLASAKANCDKSNVGIVAVYFLIILYCFLGLAIICDDFFVASLEQISEVNDSWTIV